MGPSSERRPSPFLSGPRSAKEGLHKKKGFPRTLPTPKAMSPLPSRHGPPVEAQTGPPPKEWIEPFPDPPRSPATRLL